APRFAVLRDAVWHAFAQICRVFGGAAFFADAVQACPGMKPVTGTPLCPQIPDGVPACGVPKPTSAPLTSAPLEHPAAAGRCPRRRESDAPTALSISYPASILARTAGSAVHGGSSHAGRHDGERSGLPR